jgi:hypothetical protein
MQELPPYFKGEPRVYSISVRLKALLTICGVMLAWVGVLSIGDGGCFVAAVLLAFVAWIVAFVVVSRIRLFPDAIEYRGLLGTQRLRRSEILGRKIEMVHGEYARYRNHVLVRKDSSGKALTIPMFFSSDAHFDQWINSLRDLDREELKQIEGKMLMSADSSSLEGKKEIFVFARKLTRALLVVTLAVVLWSLLYPTPYKLSLGVLIAIPWIALALGIKWPGVLVIATRHPELPSVAVPLMLPGFILCLHWYTDFWVLDFGLVQLWAIGVFLLLVSVATTFLLIPNMRDRSLIPLLLGLVCYSYGYVAMVNALLDKSTPQIYETRVERVEITHSQHPHPKITLEPWGPQAIRTIIELNEIYRNPVPVNGKVHVFVRKGPLKIRWFTVREYETDFRPSR